MRPVALSDEVAVGEMPALDQIAILSKAGFRSLLSVQPDGEVARLISSGDASKAAAVAGLAYAHVPLASRRLSDSEVQSITGALSGLPRPIYACCYSGARAAAAWASAMVPAMAPTDIAAACSAAGFDMTALLPDIARRHAKALAPSVAPVPSPPTTTADGRVQASEATTAPATAPAPIATPAPTMAPAPAAVTASPAVTAPAAVTAAEKIIFPRAAGAGGFAVAG